MLQENLLLCWSVGYFSFSFKAIHSVSLFIKGPSSKTWHFKVDDLLKIPPKNNQNFSNLCFASDSEEFPLSSHSLKHSGFHIVCAWKMYLQWILKKTFVTIHLTPCLHFWGNLSKTFVCFAFLSLYNALNMVSFDDHSSFECCRVLVVRISSVLCFDIWWSSNSVQRDKSSTLKCLTASHIVSPPFTFQNLYETAAGFWLKIIRISIHLSMTITFETTATSEKIW